jgi:nicotinamidase/pyrazinamidase
MKEQNPENLMKTALILVDIQNDFLPGGALAISNADEVIPVANRLIPEYDIVVATQDWHPENHGSFAVNHPGKTIFDQVDLNGLPQTLWPVHCVQNTEGAAFHPLLNIGAITKIFPKGTDPTIDSYSGFFDNGRRAGTGLHEWLAGQGIDAVDIMGVATDYCVKFTALDARSLNLKTRLIQPGCRGVNLQLGDVDKALEEMQAAGVELVTELEEVTP